MNIVIFDEHPVVLDSVSHYFNSFKDLRIDGLFRRKSELIHYIENHPTHIIITEFLCDEESGLRWICQLRKMCPTSIIVLYSSLFTEIQPDIIYKIGANGYLNKKSPLHDLHKLIIDVSENNPSSSMSKPVSKHLTEKEKSIINWMIQGLTSSEIALEMDCSIHTINNQKNHIIKKFGCKTSPELIAKLFRLGYLKL